jgi:hypothetical protein
MGGGASTCIINVSTGVDPRKGTRPVKASNTTIPSEYRSLRKSARRPRACSGLMYSGLPRTYPVEAPSVPAAAALAMPKSITLAVPRVVDHHVRRLEVAVDDPHLVDRGQALRDLDGHVEGAIRGQGARTQAVLQRGPGDQLHRDVLQAAVLAVFVDAADVPVADLARELDLGTEAGRHLRRARDLRTQDLERDVLVEDLVMGPIDGAHPAATERGQHPIAPANQRPPRHRGQDGATMEADLGRVVVLGLARRAEHGPA